MPADQYLREILDRERVDTSAYSPVRRVADTLSPMLCRWANGYLLRIEPSGSFAKGTGNRSGTDIDLFLSLSSSTPDTLADIRKKLGIGFATTDTTHVSKMYLLVSKLVHIKWT
jgi:tRNA nucleotidyltransferase (CCA-adding enzyme)